MATAPKADKPRCNLLGCGHYADRCTDGTEVDTQVGHDGKSLGRPALKNLNLCVNHLNWAHSDDAKAWVAGPVGAPIYKQRGA